MKTNVMNNFKITKSNNVNIDDDQLVTITFAGNQVSLKASSFSPYQGTNVRIDQMHYLVASTGEKKNSSTKHLAD